MRLRPICTRKSESEKEERAPAVALKRAPGNCLHQEERRPLTPLFQAETLGKLLESEIDQRKGMGEREREELVVVVVDGDLVSACVRSLAPRLAPDPARRG